MGNSNWDFGELDGLFNGDSKPLRKEPIKVKDSEHWISPDEWYWRAADRMLDSHRKGRGLKPITAYRRSKDIESYLEQCRRTKHADKSEVKTIRTSRLGR